MQAERLKFFKFLSGLNEEDYLISIIAYETAPTLLSHKPSSLLSFHNGPKNLLNLWKHYKERVCSILGVDFFELKENMNAVSVLFYRKHMLESCLMKPENQFFLGKQGYVMDKSIMENLFTLRAKFQAGCPHEVGIFLGYPDHDVLGFIENSGRNCLFSRYWKVYEKPDDAIKIFESFDMAKNAVMSHIGDLLLYRP